MPIISIIRREGELSQPVRPLGVIGDFPDQDGEYTLVSGETVAVEMNPPEASEKGLFLIALTSTLFEGHQRSAGYKGSHRRLIELSRRKREGATLLSSFESLSVRLQTALVGTDPVQK